MASSPEEIKKHVRTYLIVMGVLFVGTVLTWAVASFPILDFGGHGFDHVDMWIGIAIAATKATFVALIFMHLLSEKKTIYILLGIGAFFGALLLILNGIAEIDIIQFKDFYNIIPGTENLP